ncbi:MAG: minor capsid protein [Deltaproteobacteria bacterium]|nr:minor capsid protein [Deltaproteobacteria bacterium]
MAKTVNQVVLDRIAAHATDLTRVEAHLQSRVLRMLKDLERDLAATLAAIDPTGVTRSTYRQARLEKLLAQVRATIKTAYTGIRRDSLANLRDLASIEGEFAGTTLKVAIPMDLSVRFLPAEALETLATDTLIAGAPTAEWWAAQAGDLQERFKRAVRQGMLEGEGIGKLVQRVRGTKAAGFKDGIMQTSRRHAEMLVRSSVQTVANRAREKVWDANSDLISGLQWVSTLDKRTSPMCIARDGHEYGMEDHNPLDGGPPWGAGPGSLHPGCRSTSVPIIKSWRELGFDLDELPEGTRASMDGQVPESMTYSKWLEGKDAATQDEILGKGKGKLFREGKISTGDLLDNRGRPLTLKELREASGYEMTQGFAARLTPDQFREELGLGKALSMPIKDFTAEWGEINRTVGGSDPFLKTLAGMQGFTGLPSLVKSVDELPGNALLRGIGGAGGDAELFGEAFKTGEYFPGLGVYGNGAYTAYGPNAGKIASIAAGDDGVLLRMKLKPGAKVIDYNEAKAQQAKWFDDMAGDDLAKARADMRAARKMEDDAEGDRLYAEAKQRIYEITERVERARLLFEDLGRWATMEGYDAINIAGNEYMLVLNRSALAVEKELIKGGTI